MPAGDVSLRLWPTAPLLVAIGVQPMWAVMLPLTCRLWPHRLVFGPYDRCA
jgi:hypothetical protein